MTIFFDATVSFLTKALVLASFMDLPANSSCVPVYSLHGVWPTAPQAWIQSSQVGLEIGQAELVDHPVVEASAAARHQWKNVSYESK